MGSESGTSSRGCIVAILFQFATNEGMYLDLQYALISADLCS